jgi:hypothetical protein
MRLGLWVLTFQIIETMDQTILTIIQSLYLLYMYLFFKTSYSVGAAPYEKETQGMGSMFVHDTGQYENKVCLFGKIMAGITILLWVIRLLVFRYAPSFRSFVIGSVLLFDGVSLFLAYNMNLNAFAYVVPLIFGELYLYFGCQDKIKE